jgi:general secretion pathway protein G
MNFAVEFGELPKELSDLGRDQILDPWGRPYIYLRIQGRDPTDPKFKPRKDHSLHPINTDFDLCSMGRDGRSKVPLTAKDSKDDIVRANNGGFVGLVSNY